MLTGATFADILALPSRSADLRIPYGPDPNQFGDLRLPPHQHDRCPVVAFIHGGCWEAEYDLLHVNAPVSAITDLGVATWNLEYRRLGQAGGGWPGTFLDISNAIDAIRSLAKSHGIDQSRVIVMGHSAGGHLALWAASRARVPKDSDLFGQDPLAVAGVVALAAISDLAAAHAQHVCDASSERLLDGPPSEVATRYAHASPSALLPIGVPQILIHGSRDTIVPASFSSLHAEAGRALGDPADAIIIDEAGHFDVISPHSSAWPVVQDAIRSLLQ